MDITELITVPSVILFLGKTGSGKTTLAVHLLHLLKDKFKTILCLSGNPHLKQFGSVAHVESTISTSKIRSIVAKVRGKERQKKDLDKKGVCLILDDFTGLCPDTKEPIWEFLGSQSRHFGLTVLLLSQYMNGKINPTLRENISFIFLMHGVSDNTIASVQPYSSYSLPIFKKIVKTYLTKRYDFLFIDRKNLEQVFKCYKKEGKIYGIQTSYDTGEPVHPSTRGDTVSSQEGRPKITARLQDFSLSRPLYRGERKEDRRVYFFHT